MELIPINHERIEDNINENSIRTIITRIHTAIQSMPKKTTPIVVIDIDGTILDNFPRQLAILKNILEPKHSQLKGLTNKLAQLPEDQIPYTILSLIRTIIQDEIEFMGLKQSFLDSFLSNEFLHFDRVYAGIRIFVEKLLKMSCHIWYLTGRPRTLMEQGTVQRFQRAKIPLNPKNTQLIMKPSLEISDEAFKKQFFADILINPEIQVISFIDNEATMCNQAMKKIPEALIIHFLSQQSNSEIFEGISLTHWK